MADGEDGRRDPPTAPERLPRSALQPPELPQPELPSSATKFVVTVMVIGVVLAFAILVVIATSTGGSDGQRGDSAAPAVASSEEPAAEPAAPAASEAPTTPADSGDAGAAADGLDLEDITHVTVPDVVGMDLQSAQEELFPRLRTTSVDATGEDRMQLVDSNWTVVRMDPPAGELVPRFTDVTLYVVKDGESPQP